MPAPKKPKNHLFFCIGISLIWIILLISFVFSRGYSIPTAALLALSEEREELAKKSSFSIPNPPLVLHKGWQNITFKWMVDRVIIDRKHKLSYGNQLYICYNAPAKSPVLQYLKTTRYFPPLNALFFFTVRCHIALYRKTQGPL